MKINQKYIEIGLVVLILVVGICAYNFGYRPYAEKADALETEIKSLDERRQTLEGKLAREEEFKTTITNADDIINSVFKKYGPGYKIEKAIMLVDDLINKSGVSVNTVTLTNPTTVFESKASEGEDNSKDVKVTLSKLNINFGAGYTALKSMHDYINNYAERMTVDTFSVSYNSESGSMSGSASIYLYGVIDANHEYVAPVIENVLIGNENIFTTYIAPEEEETAEGETEGTEDQTQVTE